MTSTPSAAAIRSPRAAFIDPARLPIAGFFASQWMKIAEEAARLLDMPYFQDWRPYIEDDSYGGAGRWEVLSLVGGGRRSERLLQRCPVTASLVARVPDLRQALFSSLSPHARVLPHRGAAGILRVHVPVLVEDGPPRAGWRVDGVTRLCVPGDVVIFDDGELHEAWNDGAAHRVTLLVDTPAPWLDAAQRAAVLAAYDRGMELGRASAAAGALPDAT